jgi:hypothetical protein
MPSALALAMLAQNVYGQSPDTAIAPFAKVATRTLPGGAGAGFQAAAYTNADVVVVAYCGSNDRLDWTVNNIPLGIGLLPRQITHALRFYDDVIPRYRMSRRIVVGHSLGGGLAQLVIAFHLNQVPKDIGVTFNAPGMWASFANVGIMGAPSMTPDNALKVNCTNYRTSTDPVSRVGTHIGGHPLVIEQHFQISVPILDPQIIARRVANNLLQAHLMGPLVTALQHSPHRDRSF